jgi:ABC-2 type transport system permease protein
VTEAVRHSYFLMVRALRESVRQPANELANVFIPIFFFFVTIGAISNFSGRAFGVTNYAGFQLPVALLQAVAGVASSSGLGTVTDIERGYFDKLLLTPAPRLALVLGRLAADGVKAMALTAGIVGIGLLAGSGMEAGLGGAIAIVFMAGLFGVAYAGIGMSIALRTGSPQAAQAGFLVFFPLLFLSPAFAPKEFFDPWLEYLATANPVTYILQGWRSLVIEGWDWTSVGGGLAAIAGLGAFTMVLTLSALRKRTA